MKIRSSEGRLLVGAHCSSPIKTVAQKQLVREHVIVFKDMWHFGGKQLYKGINKGKKKKKRLLKKVLMRFSIHTNKT